MAASEESKHDRSNQIFNRLMSDDFITKQRSRSKAVRQRSFLIQLISAAITADGKTLAGSADLSFSRHGSFYQRLTTGAVTRSDVDIYIALNGRDRKIQGHHLYGAHPNSNITDLMSADYARSWMVKIVQAALPKDTVASISLSKRGVKVRRFGGRDYDLIPSYLVLADGDSSHFIPNEHQWEKNPTSYDMNLVRRLGENFSRDSSQKVLGFRDIVKAFKYVSAELGWGKSHQLTSFMLRCAVSIVYGKDSKPSRFNQVNIERVTDVINSWIRNRHFPDPYTKEKVSLTSTRLLSVSEVIEELLR